MIAITPQAWPAVLLMAAVGLGAVAVAAAQTWEMARRDITAPPGAIETSAVITICLGVAAIASAFLAGRWWP